MGTSWQTVGTLSQLADKGQGREVMFTAQASLMDASWLSQVVLITASEMSGSAILQLTGSEREVMWPAHDHTASSGRARMVNPGLCPVPSTHTAAVWVTLQMMRTNWQNLQPWLLLPCISLMHWARHVARRKHFISSSSPRCLSPQRSSGVFQLGCLEKVTKARETEITQSTEFDQSPTKGTFNTKSDVLPSSLCWARLHLLFIQTWNVSLHFVHLLNISRPPRYRQLTYRQWSQLQVSISTKFERIGRLALSPTVWVGICLCFGSHLKLQFLEPSNRNKGTCLSARLWGSKRMVLLKLKKI